MNDKKMLAFWKANEKPLGLCPKECREWLEKHHGMGNPVLVFRDTWEARRVAEGTTSALAYSIPADYEPEKRGRWVEYPIVKMDDRDIGMVWAFLHEHVNDSIKLSDAPGMVGFGGVKYADGWHAHPHWEGRKDSEPVKPVAVRFWVED